MSLSNQSIDFRVRDLISKMAGEGIQHSIEGLSEMVGETFRSTTPEINFVPVLRMPSLLGGPENPAVGIYLRAEGEMSGQFMLIMPINKALEFVDMLMGDPPGTTTSLEGVGRSALAEMGNLTGAYFLNSMANITGRSTVLTPPSVIFDMVGAIINIIVADAAEDVDQVITIHTNIMHHSQDVQATFWYVPDSSAIKTFTDYANKGEI